MSLHRAKALGKHRALFHLLPVMQHDAVLNRAFDFLGTARNQLSFIRANCFSPAGGAAVSELDLRAEEVEVGDTVV